MTCAAVQRMRRREHDRVDLGIGEQRLVTLGEPEALRAGERLDLRRTRARRARDEAGSPSLVPCTDSTSVLPHQPSPTIALAPDHLQLGLTDLAYVSSGSARTSDRRPALGHRQAELLLARCSRPAPAPPSCRTRAGRLIPSRPMPQSEDRTSRSAGMCFSAARASSATSVGRLHLQRVVVDRRRCRPSSR